MPPQKTTISLVKKLGKKLVEAHQAKAGEEYKASGGAELPDGISNGVARLTSCKFGVYEKGDLAGEPFFMASGVVVDTPQNADLKWCVGLRTQVGPEPICDTPTKSRKTVEDHLGWIYNLWRGLGVDTNSIQADKDGALEAVAEALQSAKPYFRFRTWKGQVQTTGPYAGKEPRVNHDWGQACEWADSDGGGQVEDDSAAAPPPPPKPAAKTAKPATKKAPEPEPEPASDYSDADDVDSLLAIANDDSDPEAQADAQQKLKDQAMALGHSEEACDGTDSWEALVDLIKGGAPSTDGDDSEPWTPKKEEVYLYAPIDPKTKKAGKKIECEVVAVDAAKQTVDLKNTVNQKLTYKAIPWSKLEGQ